LAKSSSQFAIFITLISILIGAFLRDRLDRMMTITVGTLSQAMRVPNCFGVPYSCCLLRIFNGRSKERPMLRRVARWFCFGIMIVFTFSMSNLPISPRQSIMGGIWPTLLDQLRPMERR